MSAVEGGGQLEEVGGRRGWGGGWGGRGGRRGRGEGVVEGGGRGVGGVVIFVICDCGLIKKEEEGGLG